MATRNFDSNTQRASSFLDGTSFLYGWKNSETDPDKDFKILFDDLNISGFTAGSVLFAGSDGLLSEDNNNLFYDSTLGRLGIQTNSPTSFLDVVGDGVNPIFSARESGGSSVIGVSSLGDLDLGFTNRTVRINSHNITGGIASFSPTGASCLIWPNFDIKAVPALGGVSNLALRITTDVAKRGIIRFYRQDSLRGVFSDTDEA